MIITKINRLTVLLLVMICSTFSMAAASEAEYKKLAKTWILNADGSQEFHYTMELTLYTHAAMNGKYGESFIVYNPLYQTLKINEAYTKQKNGEIIQTPINALVEVLPRNAAHAPAYNHLKEMVVVHTGLELGATIHLDYTLSSKAGYLPELDIFEMIQQSSPVKEYTLTAVTPADKPLNYALANSKANAMVREEGGKQIVSWTLRNVPQQSTASFTHISNGDLPYLAATTFANSKMALQTLKDQLVEENDEIRSVAAKLTKKSNNKTDQLKAIVNYVNKQCSACSLTLEQTGYRFRSANKVINTAYGTEMEKANLLTALLRSSGFEAEILVGYPISSNKGLALKAIDHLYVSVDNQQYVLSINTLNRPQPVVFGQSPVYSILEGKRIHTKPAADYQLKCEQIWNVTHDKWSVSTKEKIGSDLLPYFTAKESVNEFTMPIKSQSGYTTLVLPGSDYGFSNLGYGRLNSERDGNLLLPRLVNEAYTYTINCPENMKLRTINGHKEIHNLAGDLVFSIQKEGTKISVHRSLILKKQLYSASEYAALRQLLGSWSDVNSRTMIFSVN